MRAAVMRSPNVLELEDVADPVTPKGGALVRIEVCSVCGTDVKMLEHGHKDLVFPRILGHEIVGRIEELDAEIEGIDVGDRVQVWPGIACGRCRPCLRGNDNQCETEGILGFNVDGGFAEQVALPAGNVGNGGLNKVSPSSNGDLLSLSEPLACCLNGQELTRVTEGDRVLILGGGPVGAIHTALAKHLGAEVMVAERLPLRVKLLQGHADRVIDIASEDLEKAVDEQTDGKGADVILPATPEMPVNDRMLRMLAPNGRLCVFSGPRKGEYETVIDVRSMHYRELTMVGAYGCSSRNDREAVELIASGNIDLDWIVTKRSSLEDIHDAIEHTSKRLGMKSMIRM